MKRYKALAIICVMALLLSACSSGKDKSTGDPTLSPVPLATFSPSADKDSIFPFYIIDAQNKLCRVQAGSEKPDVIELGFQVLYNAGGAEHDFLHFNKSADTLYFATEFSKKNEDILCTLYQYKDGQASVIDTNILINSIQMGKEHMLYIARDAKRSNSLYIYSKDVRKFYAEKVKEAYFSSVNDDVVYISTEKTEEDIWGGKLYPLYSIQNGSGPLLLSYANSIAKIDITDGRICALKNTRTIEQINDRIQVADAYIFTLGQERLEVKNVMVEWLSEDNIQATFHYALCYVEGRRNRLGKLYRIDEGIAELISDNVLEGKMISPDSTAFAFEIYPEANASKASVQIIDKLGTKSALPANVKSSINDLYYDTVTNNVFLLNKEQDLKKLYAFRYGGEPVLAEISPSIQQFYGQNGGAIYTLKNTSDKFFSVYFTDGENVYKAAGNVLLLEDALIKFNFTSDNLLYFSEDITFSQGGINLCRSSKGKDSRILLWNLVPSGGLLYNTTMTEVAAICKSSSTSSGLFISANDGTVIDAQHTAIRFIQAH